MVLSKTYQALQKILALNNIQTYFNYKNTLTNNNEMGSGIFPVNGFQIKLFLTWTLYVYLLSWKDEFLIIKNHTK